MSENEAEQKQRILVQMDQNWETQRQEYGWSLPPKAFWFFRLPGVRKVRYAWLTVQAQRAACEWAAIGVGYGYLQPYDQWVMYAIARGWC